MQPPPSERGRGGPWIAAGAVFALALALRLAFLWSGADADWPHSLRYEGDAPVWARWAAALERGERFEFDLPLRTPGVAFALEALGFTKPPFAGAKALWSVLSAATCSGLWLLLAAHVSRRAAWFGALALCVSNGALQLATSLNSEAPYAALLVALLGLHLLAPERRTLRTAALTGVLHGLALLLRAEHLAFLALIAVSQVRELLRSRQAAGWWAVCTAALLATCAPWSLRSRAAVERFNREAPRLDFERASPPWTAAARAELEALPGFAREGNFAFVSHLARQARLPQVDAEDVRAYFAREWGYTPEPLPEWTLVSFKGPLDFALANHPDARGGFSRAGLFDGRDAAPEFSFARPSHLELLLHGYSKGLEHLRGDPARAGANLLAKLVRFLRGVDGGLGADNWPHGPASRRWPVDMAVAANPAPAWTGLMLAVTLAGAWTARRSALGRLLLLAALYKLAVCVAFYGYARQAASILPVWCALAALAATHAATRAEARFGARVTGRAGAFVLVLLLAPAIAALRPTALEVSTSTQAPSPAPAWGPGAFESAEELALTPAKRP